MDEWTLGGKWEEAERKQRGGRGEAERRKTDAVRGGGRKRKMHVR